MPNVVTITIKANDASAAGFAGAMARIEALKKAASGVGFNFDAPNMASQLHSLKQKMQSAGIADLLDYNLNQGQIGQQLLMLKRKIQQAGISDMLDINLDQNQIAQQLDKIANDNIQIPVSWDVSHLPQLGAVSHIQPVDVPVHFDLGNMGALGSLPKFGETVNVNNLGAATQGFRALNLSADALQKSLLSVENLSANLDAVFAHQASQLDYLGLGFSKAAAAAVQQSESDQLVANLSQIAHDRFLMETAALGGVTAAMKVATIAANNNGMAMVTAGHGGSAWGLVFRILTAHVELFGGVMTAMGIPPILAAASGLHILMDSLIEITAVVVPAAIAFTAFGLAAIPTLALIYQKMKAVAVTSTALGQAIYPLSGGFSKIASAVKPEVYQLFGDALVVMGSKAGVFQSIAVGAGKAMDQLGARTAAAMGGMGGFLANGVTDLSEIGNVFGNIFGIFGNILHVMPGYAEDLLAVMDKVTGGIENLTSNGLVQWLLGLGLAFHGAILWLGLAATGAVYLGNAVVGLAAKFGLATEGALAFDAVQFGAGLATMVGFISDLAIALVTFAGSEEIATAATGVFESAMIALDAVNPMVWIGVAVVALGALVYWLSRGQSATASFDQAISKSLSGTPVTQLDISLTADQAITLGKLRDAQAKLNDTTRTGVTGMNHAGVESRGLTYAYQQQSAVVQGYKGELSTIAKYQTNYNVLLKAAHGNVTLMNTAGITSNQIMSASGQTLKQYIVEVQAAALAQQAMALGIGRSAAAQNAQTNSFMTQTLPALQTVTKAEDNLMSVILAGPQSFIGFQLAIQTMGKDAAVAGSSLNGLNANSLALANDFYTTTVPAAQKLIDSLQQQGISTKDLTVATADQVSQMLPFTRGNTEAKSVMVDLINNALGPGTVSMQSLNTWVKNNAGSLQGFNSIVAASTIQAGNLANVLSGMLTVQFHAALLQASGASGAIKIYTSDLVHNQDQTAAGVADRNRLISDLEAAGFSAQQAKNYVNGLQTSINNMHGKSVGVGVIGGWSIQKENDAPGVQHLISTNGGLKAASGGWRVPGFGGGDKWPALLEGGEAVIDKNRTKKYAHLLAMMGVPGFSAGGIMGNGGAMINMDTNAGISDAFSAMNGLVAAAVKSAQAAATAALSPAGHIPTGGGSGPVKALAQQMAAGAPWGWTGSQWNALDDVEMREAGWNLQAQNPTSSAYGIAQFINGAGEYAQYGGNWYTAQGQITGFLNYVKDRYGVPSNAWAHEEAFNWYGNGLDAIIRSPTVIGVGEKGAEHVSVTPVGAKPPPIVLEFTSNGSAFDTFMTNWIQKSVQIKGGGNVQVAFGRSDANG